MTTQNTLHKTCFNHNDVLLECWYDQTLEQSDENEIIDFDNVKGRHIFGEAYLNWLNDELSLNLQFDGMYFPVTIILKVMQLIYPFLKMTLIN